MDIFGVGALFCLLPLLTLCLALCIKQDPGTHLGSKGEQCLNPGFGHSPAVWSWPIYPNSQTLRFFTCKMGPAYLLHFVVVRIKRELKHKASASQPTVVLNNYELVPLVCT